MLFFLRAAASGGHKPARSRCFFGHHRATLRLCCLLAGLLAGAGRARAQAQASALAPPAAGRAPAARPALPDTARVRQLAQLAARQLGTNLPAATQAATQGLALARRGPDAAAQARLLNLVGACHYLQGDVVAARHAYEALLALARRSGLAQARGNAYMGMAQVAAHTNDTLHVPGYCAQALAAYRACRPPASTQGQARVFDCLGYFYRRTHQAAYDAQGQASLIRNDTPSERAKRMFRKVLALPPAGLATERASALCGLANEYTLVGQAALAQPCYDQALALAPAQSAVWLKAAIYSAQNQLVLGRLRPALALAQHVRRVARRAGNATMAENALILTAEALEDLHVRGSFDSLQVYISESAASMQADQVAAVTAAGARFEAREQAARIRSLEQDRRLVAQGHELTRLRARQQLAGLGGGIVLLLLGAGLLFARYRQRQAAAAAAAETLLRQQIAADLHDDVGSLLTQVSLQSDLLSQGLLPAAQHPAQLQRMASTSRDAVRHMSDVVWGLSQLGHAPTLGPLLDRMRDHAHLVLPAAGLDLNFAPDPTLKNLPVPTSQQQVLFLIFKESLHNAVKHAQAATEVTVHLRHKAGQLKLTIRDDGRPPAAAPTPRPGHGLANMPARALAVGGTVRYEVGEGFAVVARLPVG